jgi:hypothetical protein
LVNNLGTPTTLLISFLFLNNIAIVIQRLVYGTAQPSIPLDEEDILEQALRLEQEDQGIPHRGIVEQGV